MVLREIFSSWLSGAAAVGLAAYVILVGSIIVFIGSFIIALILAVIILEIHRRIIEMLLYPPMACKLITINVIISL